MRPASGLYPNLTRRIIIQRAYRITARFLVWTEKNYNKKLVDKLDNAMRTKTYKADIWKELTGKTLDELWGEYAKNPVI